jgi:hypothetical protein
MRFELFLQDRAALHALFRNAARRPAENQLGPTSSASGSPNRGAGRSLSTCVRGTRCLQQMLFVEPNEGIQVTPTTTLVQHHACIVFGCHLTDAKRLGTSTAVRSRR